MSLLWKILKRYGAGPVELASRVLGAVLDFGKKVLVYLCLAVVLTAGYILDLIDPEDTTTPPAV